MTQVRFGNNNSGGWAYKAAEWTYALPDKAEKKISPILGERVGGFIKNQLNSDFAHFTNVQVGNKFKTMIAEPPRLPLLLLLYPGTVGPRLYRAYQRGKENNDYREMGDVLRRDLTAITLFVFALGPMVKGTSKAVQAMTGVNLLDGASKSVLSYSQFRNYEITNGKALWQVVKEGNGDGLKKAIGKLNDGGLKEHHYGALNKTLGTLKEKVNQFVDEFAPTQPNVAKKSEDAALAQAKGVYKYFEQAEKDVQTALESAGKKNSKEVIEITKKLQGQAKDALKNYAKVRRLPTDMFAFAVMIGAIGWLPMAFNGWWNKKQFEKKHAAGEVSANPAQKAPIPQPQPTPQASGVQNFSAAFAAKAQPFSQPLNFRNFSTLAPQQPPMNPFNRVI